MPWPPVFWVVLQAVMAKTVAVVIKHLAIKEARWNGYLGADTGMLSVGLCFFANYYQSYD
jgi:hypothetical protein